MNLLWLILYARAADYNLIQPLPGLQKVSSFPEYVSGLIPFVLSLAAVLAVLMIVIGGVEYAVSLSEEGKKLARGRINNAILGLLLALLSYLILYTINPDLINMKLDIGSIGNTVGAPTTNTGGQPPIGVGTNAGFQGNGGKFGGAGANCQDFSDPNCQVQPPTGCPSRQTQSSCEPDCRWVAVTGGLEFCTSK